MAEKQTRDGGKEKIHANWLISSFPDYIYTYTFYDKYYHLLKEEIKDAVGEDTEVVGETT